MVFCCASLASVLWPSPLLRHRRAAVDSGCCALLLHLWSTAHLLLLLLLLLLRLSLSLPLTFSLRLCGGDQGCERCRQDYRLYPASFGHCLHPHRMSRVSRQSRKGAKS